MRLGKWIPPVLLALGLAGCAGSAPQAASQDAGDASWQPGTAEEVEALKRAVEASYDRERSLAERLRLAEQANEQMREAMAELRSRSAAHRALLDSLQASGSMTPPEAESEAVGARAVSDVASQYREALGQYRNRNYQQALDRFTAVLGSAPYSEWADNAQYWKGECYYGLGQYRQALTEFTKVFAFQNTEKDDDAQLKIARCYLALGEKERALAAFQKLIDEYPGSEYVPTARKEMRYLQGS